MSTRGRLGVALGVSFALHVLILLAVPGPQWAKPHEEPARIIPISLFGAPGGGEGGGRRAAVEEPSPAPPVTTPPVAPPPTTPTPSRVVKKAPPPPTLAPVRKPPSKEVAKVTPPPTADGPPAPGAGSGRGQGLDGEGTGPGSPGQGGGHGGGSGGGEGDGDARIAYGANPRPPYPLPYRRLGMEGTVELDVRVAPDGRAMDVRVGRSSGHPELDALAADTVRTSWRFQPARRNGVPVEGRVTVPIRFLLRDEG